jgi:hypothetical protein
MQNAIKLLYYVESDPQKEALFDIPQKGGRNIGGLSADF